MDAKAMFKIEPTAPAVNKAIRQAGLKVTLSRVKILQVIASSSTVEAHLSAEDVYKKLLNAGDDIGLGTVYRILAQFETVGLVYRHHFDGDRSVFELAAKNRHDHMVCLDSGNIVDFSEAGLQQQLQHTAQKYGYELADYALVLYVRKK